MNELVTLFEHCFPDIYRSPEAIREIVEREGYARIEHREDNRLVGAAVVHGEVIYLLCVEPEYRRRGIGSMLLQRAEEAIRAGGHARAVIGAGDGYLTPGVPMKEQAHRFFEERGYKHAWDEGECFDMEMELKDFCYVEHRIGDSVDGICYEMAQASDIPAIVECIREAEEGFVPFYADSACYEGESGGVLIAREGDAVCGALMVDCETAGRPIGSIGCTAVSPRYRRRGIATMLVLLATRYLKEQGLTRSMLEYTYTGLDRLYGAAGYRISMKYFMAEKIFH